MGYHYLNLLNSKALRHTSVEDLSALEEIGTFCVLVATGNQKDKAYSLDLLRTYNPLFEVGIKRKALTVEVYLSINPSEDEWDLVTSIPETLFVEDYPVRST